tara:strand:+ start:827 stop:1213 length:387 start_codon:yes stop_codon:yes gene_type:complete
MSQTPCSTPVVELDCFENSVELLTFTGDVDGAINGEFDQRACDDTPEPVDEIGGAGASTKYSRCDHVHAHGDLTGGNLHDVASSSAEGFMSTGHFDLVDQATDNRLPSTIVMRDSNDNIDVDLNCGTY